MPDVSAFLIGIAKAESRLGKHPDTFRKNYYGGIWQIDAMAFKDAKDTKSHPSLIRILPIIDNCLSQIYGKNMTWLATNWQDCTIPLFSCLAARLFLAVIPEAAPISAKDQATYWKKYYNKNGRGSEKHFSREARLEEA